MEGVKGEGRVCGVGRQKGKGRGEGDEIGREGGVIFGVKGMLVAGFKQFKKQIGVTEHWLCGKINYELVKLLKEGSSA